MKFLCLCYYDAEQFASLTPDDFKEIGELCAPHDKKLKESGHLTLVGSLAMPEESRVIQAGKTGASERQGPYVKTPEPLGAFFIVEAESLAKATEIAWLHPGAKLGDKFGGGIEIRPIDMMETL